MLDAEFKQLLTESKKVNMSRSSSRAKIADHRHRKTEQEEDAELLQDEEDEDDERTIFRESPTCNCILLLQTNGSHQRRGNERLPSPRLELVNLPLRKRYKRNSRRRNGNRKNSTNDFLPRLPSIPPWSQ